MANNQAFCITYGGKSRSGNTFVPYTAIAHSADEAIAIINTWKTYGHRDENIHVNDYTAGVIRELFENGFVKNCVGRKSTVETLRTTGCGCWDIVIYPALADTLEEHNRIYKEKCEAAKQERMRKAEEAKQHRLAELNEQKRGWYHVSLKIRVYVFAARGNDYMDSMNYSCDMIADSGMDAYNKVVEYLKNHPEELNNRVRDNMIALQDWVEPTSYGYEFLFLGVKTDEGYSVEKWEEWHKNGEI
jgi:hypothetical protein